MLQGHQIAIDGRYLSNARMFPGMWSSVERCHYQMPRSNGQRFFLGIKDLYKKETASCPRRQLAGGRRRAEALRSHFAHILVFFLA